MLGNDITIYPVKAALTSDGVQYSAEVATTTADTDVVLFSYSVDLGIADMYKRDYFKALWVYFNVVVALKANSSGTADLKWKAQARNKGGTWVDLFAYQTESDIGTTYVDKKMEGYANLQANFEQVPFDFQILYQCNELNEGRGKLKNSTLFRAVFKSVFE